MITELRIGNGTRMKTMHYFSTEFIHHLLQQIIEKYFTQLEMPYMYHDFFNKNGTLFL